LVPAEKTHAVFQLSGRVRPQIEVIPEGGHLDGLKNHRDFYAPRLREFLKSFD
jgi:hypothetical protein